MTTYSLQTIKHGREFRMSIVVVLFIRGWFINQLSKMLETVLECSLIRTAVQPELYNNI